MKILIAGGSGLIGRTLTQSLLENGHEVFVLTRRPASAKLPQGAKAIPWDGQTVGDWLHVLEQSDAVVTLAGQTLASWPWTEAKKQRFFDSRVRPALVLAEACGMASHRPKVFAQASAIGYYGPRGNLPITEADSPGKDLGARICQQAEAASKPVEMLGIRHVSLRTAVVLAQESIILKLMALPVRLFMGGPLGKGTQGFSWIHIADEVAAIRFLLENEQAEGAFNLSAPEPLSNAEFTKILAKVLRRPYWLPVPAFLLRLVLGEMSTLVLEGQFVLPERLQKLGFQFRFPRAEEALRDLLNG
ncbi:MAG: TIGR01777 family oxidoreductase [Candidatus Villigracilaceae bacterium]